MLINKEHHILQQKKKAEDAVVYSYIWEFERVFSCIVLFENFEQVSFM